jgi:hypothetical protein
MLMNWIIQRYKKNKTSNICRYMGIDLKIRVKNADYDARLCTYIYICVFSMSIYPPKMFFFRVRKSKIVSGEIPSRRVYQE